MLRRKIYNELLEWKNKRKSEQRKECLMVKGARQVGKSFIIREFGKSEYKTFIEINFIKNPEYKSIFDGSLSAVEIFKRLTATFSDVNFINGNTLIFLDEIQKCANARTAIKFLAEEFRFDVISSGSLLGLSYAQDDDEEVAEPDSIPVGYEKNVIMYSLDFEEFLWANGMNEVAIDVLKEYFESGDKIPDVINEKYENLFKEFMVVGGMPEVVADFIVHKDYNRVTEIQNKILADYQDDISKHAKGAEKVKVRECYDAIPRQLSKELKKFQYSTVERGQTSKKYGGSVKWLKDSCLVNACVNVAEPYISLIGNEKQEQFKLYYNDTGLLFAAYGAQTRLALLTGTLKGNTKGGVFENAIAECLIKRGYTLHYYHPDDTHELEFLIEKGGEVVPVEVKASNAASVTLNNFIKDFKPSVAYKLIGGNNGIDGVKRTLPHYMVMFI